MPAFGRGPTAHHTPEHAMSDAIFVLNGGSSSLKFSIYRVGDQEDLALVARGQVESLGRSPRFKAKDRKGHVLADERPTDPPPEQFGHAEAFNLIAQWARERYGGGGGAGSNGNGNGALQVAAIGHRVVHGGLEFAEPVVVDDT